MIINVPRLKKMNELDVTPMVRDAKAVAGNIRDQGKANQWRGTNKDLLDSVGQVRIAVAGPDAVVEPQIDMASLQLGTYNTFF